MNRVLHWSPVVLGVMFLLSLAYLQRERTLKGQNDFVQLYTAAKLAGTPDLYSRSANLATIRVFSDLRWKAVEVHPPSVLRRTPEAAGYFALSCRLCHLLSGYVRRA